MRLEDGPVQRVHALPRAAHPRRPQHELGKPLHQPHVDDTVHEKRNILEKLARRDAGAHHADLGGDHALNGVPNRDRPVFRPAFQFARRDFRDGLDPVPGVALRIAARCHFPEGEMLATVHARHDAMRIQAIGQSPEGLEGPETDAGPLR